MAVLFGSACHKHATIPAKIGQAKDVPWASSICPVPPITIAGLPIDITSGLTLPSAEGPTELKVAFKCSVFNAPTAKVLGASAGTFIFFQCLFPSLPALLTWIIPFVQAWKRYVKL